MALSVTSWPQAVEYRAVHQDNLTNSLNSNVTGAPCTITSIIFDNTGGSAITYLKIVNGYSATIGTTQAHLKFRDLPKGISLDVGLTFWGTLNATNTDNSSPTLNTNQTIKVTFVVTSLKAY